MYMLILIPSTLVNVCMRVTGLNRRGLLVSNMVSTAEGMINNLLSLIQKHGFVPNGKIPMPHAVYVPVHHDLKSSRLRVCSLAHIMGVRIFL